MVDQLSHSARHRAGHHGRRRPLLLDRKITDYTAKAKQYDTEKAEIKKTRRGVPEAYDRLNIHDDQFDMAEACLSVSIALLGVTALTQKRWLLAMGFVFAVFGFALGISGFLGYNFHPNFLAKLLGLEPRPRH